MKMGTIRSPCPYDVAPRHALQPVNLRWPAILRYASWVAVFPISQNGPVTFPIAALAIDPEIDVTCPGADLSSVSLQHRLRAR
jgi:hypothetical protein